jgi:hypothetical protein
VTAAAGTGAARAWQEHWLTDCIDEHKLDAVLWHCTQTLADLAASIDATLAAADEHQRRLGGLADGEHQQHRLREQCGPVS